MTLLRLHTFRPSTVADVVAAAQPRLAAAQPSRPSAPGALPTEPKNSPSAPERAEALKHEPLSAESDWRSIVAALPLSGLARTLAQHCELRRLDDTECLLRLAPAHSHLQMKPAPERLQQAVSDYFARPLRLRFELADNETATPAATAGRERQERQEKAVAAIEQDGFVREVIESFDATLVESSIKPIA
jgi:DNA polymerase-3 subunit gamma/tau